MGKLKQKTIFLTMIIIGLLMPAVLGDSSTPSASYVDYDISGSGYTNKCSNSNSETINCEVGSESSPDSTICQAGEGNVNIRYRKTCEEAGTQTITYTSNPIYNINYDSDQDDCECNGDTWFSNLGTWSGSSTQCCGDDGGSDDFSTYSGSLTTSTSLSCRDCLNGADQGTSTLYGNGYISGTTCYHGDITCGSGSSSSGSTCTLTGNNICGDGVACTDCSPYVNSSSTACYADCSSNDDNKCVSGYHCSGSNTCVADFATGSSCVEDSDCASNYCRDDYDSGKFCAADSNDCVHDGSTYNTGSSLNGWYCNSGSWQDQDTTQSACTNAGNDWYTNLGTWSGSSTQCCGDDGGSDDFSTYSGSLTTSTSLSCRDCLNGADQGTSTLYGNGYISGTTCYHGDITCGSGSSSSGSTCTLTGNNICGDGVACTDCSPYVNSSSTACYADCSSNDDNKCVSGYHCDASNNCIADLSDGSSCVENSDCTSGYCRDDYDGGKFCADDSTSCVHDGTDFNSGQESEGYTCSAITNGNWSDITPPEKLTVQNVDGDASSPYWDTSDNGQNYIQLQTGEVGIQCRISTQNTDYDSMSSYTECSGTTTVGCNLSLSQSASYTYYVACKDSSGNLQEGSNITQVDFGVDWTDPTTFMSNYGSYYLPGHNVTVNEQDNVGTVSTITTYECHPNTGCSPTTVVDNGSKIMLTNRGTNYVRWYSTDAAANDQDESEIVVTINSLPVPNSSLMNYGIGSGDYTGETGKRVFFYCDGNDVDSAVDGNSGYSAKIWLRHNTSGSWNVVTGDSMTWSAIDGRWQYNHLLDHADDIYGVHYDMMCEITDDLGEAGNNVTKLGVFSVINTPPYADEITVNDSSAVKYDWIRWYCSGADADAPTHQESTLVARFWLRTQGAGSWDKLENVTMTWGGVDHYLDYQVLEDGGTHYDARCQLSDGVDESVFYDEFQTEYNVNEDWDQDGISDASDTVEGYGNNLNTSDSVTILVGGSEVNTSSGSQKVEFLEGGETFAEFDWDFDSADLETPFITVERVSTGERGGVVVSGLTGVSKSLRVPKILGSGNICLKNSSVTRVDEISSGCEDADEILFTNCAGGETIGGITCTDNGTFYEVSGVMHSAVKEFGSSRLHIWSEGPYWQFGNVSFYANYTNSTSNATITSADCEIYFSDTGWDDMNFNSVEWEYQRVFTSEGQRTYEVNCTHATYTDLHTTDDFTITSSAIPEFSTITLIGGMLAVLAGLIMFRRKK